MKQAAEKRRDLSQMNTNEAIPSRSARCGRRKSCDSLVCAGSGRQQFEESRLVRGYKVGGWKKTSLRLAIGQCAECKYAEPLPSDPTVTLVGLSF